VLVWSVGSAVAGLELLLPHLADVVVDAVEHAVGRIRIVVRAKAAEGVCGSCGTGSRRVHSRYTRSLADLAIGGRRVEIRLRSRRWLCSADACAVRTFAEQVEGLCVRYGRRTLPLRQALQRIAMALAGRAGARLSEHLAMGTGRSTMLRLIRATPDPAPVEVRVVGVDDFAVRRGHRYGTVVIDLDSHRPIDLLPDREAGSVSRWLAQRPTVTVVCRDRASAYADAARTGAPQAIQVADRWHLWHNLAQQVEKTVARHRRCVPPLEVPQASHPPQAPRQVLPSESCPAGGLAVRASARHQHVHDLVADGKPIAQICRELGLSRGTVRRFARAANVQDLLPGPRRRNQPSILQPFEEHLRRRWDDGVTNAADLLAEIRLLGYHGGSTVLREYVRPWRDGLVPTAPPARPLTTRQISSLILRHPDDLDTSEQEQHRRIQSACHHLTSLVSHVHRFATMLTTLQGNKLDAWMAAVDADDQPDLRSFVAGIRRDYDAVRNGLTLSHNSGPVEGHVNRIKMIKRQMYGRANFDLLRKRVLLA
jgi:transposase